MTTIDLLPIADNRAASEVILLARGQLNRAFRQRGLFPPDPLPAGRLQSFDVVDLDDPVRGGLDHARDAYGVAFLDWSAELPAQLLSPVLAILGRTLVGLQAAVPADPDAIRAVEDACDYLLQQAPRPA